MPRPRSIVGPFGFAGDLYDSYLTGSRTILHLHSLIDRKPPQHVNQRVSSPTGKDEACFPAAAVPEK